MSRYGGEPHYAGYGGGGAERWDPERFERERADRSRGPALVERDRYEEHDFFQPRPQRAPMPAPPRRRERSAEGYYDRAGGNRFAEKDVYISEERFGPPARLPRAGPGRYYDEEIDSFDEEPGRGQMIRRMDIERDYAPSPRRAPPRPGIIRRQSSLDTFDRKPLPRYGAPLRAPPETIVMPVRERRNPSPPRYVDRDYYEEHDFFEEDYKGGFRERERSTIRKRRSSPSPEPEYREIDTYEEVVEEEVEKPFPRKGKTRMPRRLVNKRAVIELGYPFEEEEDTVIILKALAKEHIDEIIKLSKEMNERNESREVSQTTTYLIEGPPPPPEPEVIERRTTEIIIDPPIRPLSEAPRSVREWDQMSVHSASTVKAGGHSAKGGHSVKGSVKGAHSVKGGHSEHGGGHSVKGGHSEHGGGHSVKGGHSEHGGNHAEHFSEHISEHYSEHGGHHADHHSRSSHRSPSPNIVTRRPSHSHSRHRSRSVAEYHVDDEVGESNTVAVGPLALLPSLSSKKDERSIKAEIRALEAERRMLKYERGVEKEHRKSQRYKESRPSDGDVIIERTSRHRDPEIVIERPDREREIKIEKDKKAPTPGMLKAMLATLT